MGDGIDLDLSGFQEMLDTLNIMTEEASKIITKALNEGIKPVKSAVERHAPVYAGPDKKGTIKGLLKANIKVGKVKRSKGGVYSQVVGTGRDDISKVFYGKFSEYGSKHEIAKPWMRPAYDESKDEAYRIIETVIQDGIQQSFDKK